MRSLDYARDDKGGYEHWRMGKYIAFCLVLWLKNETKIIISPYYFAISLFPPIFAIGNE